MHNPSCVMLRIKSLKIMRFRCRFWWNIISCRFMPLPFPLQTLNLANRVDICRVSGGRVYFHELPEMQSAQLLSRPMMHLGSVWTLVETESRCQNTRLMFRSGLLAVRSHTLRLKKDVSLQKKKKLFLQLYLFLLIPCLNLARKV